MRSAYFLIVLLSVLLTGCERRNGSFVCHFGVPGGDQYAITKIISQHILTNYPALADRSADNTKKGKIYYLAPGCVPSFTFYEIVEPDDMQRIETLVRESLDLAGIEKVHLSFYERQNMVGGHRGHEKTIKSITVTRQN